MHISYLSIYLSIYNCIMLTYAESGYSKKKKIVTNSEKQKYQER